VCGPGQYLDPNFTTGCLQCPAGLYSVGGAVGGCTSCPPGTFGSSPGLSTPACSGNCNAPAGNACLTGSTSATGTLCPVGQYSLAGSSVRTNCSAGTYGSSMGLTTAACSGLCAAGRFGSVSGLSSSSCEGACTAGYACPAGSINATAAVCLPGQYSLSGWSTCSQCSVGLYGESPALPSSTCTAPCPPGRFGSIPGLSTPACSGPCDAGRFGSQPGVNASSCTAACPAGYFCPPGTANATEHVRLFVTAGNPHTTAIDDVLLVSLLCFVHAVAQPCGNVTVYCPEGSAGPVAVPSGSYSTPEASDASLRDGAAVCLAGMYCVGGVKVCARRSG
jgi:hypothetical protein